MKKLLALVLSLAALIVAGVASIAHFDPFGDDSIDRSGPTMLVRIRNLQEFTAAEANFTQDVDIEKDAKFLPKAIKGERVVAIVTGTVRATVDFGGLNPGSIEVNEGENAIHLWLPQPQLSNAEIDEKSARILVRDRGLVDRVDDFFAKNPTDDGPVYRLAEKKLNAAAVKSDLVSRARTNTEAWLTTFLGAAGFDTVKVSWRRG